MSGWKQTDFDLIVWFLRIHDHCFTRLNVHQLVLALVQRFQRKFLVFSDLKFALPAPRIDKSRNRFGRNRHLFLHESELLRCFFVLQRQFGNIDLGAVLVRLIFFREPDDLEPSTANCVANPEELRWLFRSIVLIANVSPTQDENMSRKGSSLNDFSLSLER